MISFGRPGSRARKVYSLTVVIVITFVMFVIFSNVRMSWGSEDDTGFGTMLEDLPGITSQPMVVMDDDGNAMAVWYQDTSINGDKFSLYACHYVGGSWGSTVMLEHEEGCVHYADVAMNGDGDAIVVWSQDDPTGYQRVWANLFINGSWQGAVSIEQEEGASDSPLVAMNDDGEATVVWHTDHGYGNYCIMTNSFTGADWTDPTIMASGNESMMLLDVSMNDAGDAATIWRQRNATDVIWLFASVMKDGIWGNASRIGSEGSSFLYEAKVVVDSKGDDIVVWNQWGESYNGCYIFANTFSNGSWGEAIVLDGGNVCADSPDLVIDGQDRAIAVWCRSSTSSSIYSSIYEGGAWGEVRSIEDAIGYSYPPHIATDGNGNAIVAWPIETSSDHFDICSVELSNDTWGQVTTVGKDVGVVYYVDVAMNADGNSMMVWWHVEDDVGSVRALPDEGDDGTSISWLVIPGVLIAFAVTITALTSWRHRND